MKIDVDCLEICKDNCHFWQPKKILNNDGSIGWTCKKKDFCEIIMNAVKEVWQNPESLNVQIEPIELDEDCGVVAYKCPHCMGIVGFKSEINSHMPDKCDNCGQHLNWSRIVYDKQQLDNYIPAKDEIKIIPKTKTTNNCYMEWECPKCGFMMTELLTRKLSAKVVKEYNRCPKCNQLLDWESVINYKFRKI